jgi:hypothetical protein
VSFQGFQTIRRTARLKAASGAQRRAEQQAIGFDEQDQACLRQAKNLAHPFARLVHANCSPSRISAKSSDLMACFRRSDVALLKVLRKKSRRSLTTNAAGCFGGENSALTL